MRYLAVGLLLISTSSLWATDFDDGIGYDDAIDDTIEIDRNIKFIVLKAKSKANRGKDDVEKKVSSGIGNIEFGVGSKLKNLTIINLSNNKGGVAVSEGK